MVSELILLGSPLLSIISQQAVLCVLLDALTGSADLLLLRPPLFVVVFSFSSQSIVIIIHGRAFCRRPFDYINTLKFPRYLTERSKSHRNSYPLNLYWKYWWTRPSLIYHHPFFTFFHAKAYLIPTFTPP